MKQSLLDSSIGYLINRTALNLNNLLARRIKDYNITPEQFVLISRLMEEEGISQRELAIRSEKDPPGITRMLDNMLAKGLITKEHNDRRSLSIFLTEKARTIYYDLEKIEQQTMKDIVQGLTEEQIHSLKIMLTQIKGNIGGLE
ncbi:MarR family winged helix-turn-helix transcriptional regulator [Neobacillus niacini]|uniref:MarR family winged helix-turn-helix transcriptional regulator n=1 Tax=Neobacillus niacini TaxID=86668 RepID=UPI0021CB766D|nr:MarR family transcriptional regulator [Neobacillus niacini]MCM3766117.1 MarR family transcriptional regulator [Neobacillus niacini]